MPPTDDRYSEIETAKKHGGWYVWTRCLHPQERAELMAHELHRSMREHYYFDVRAPGEKAEKPKRGEFAWDEMRKRVGLI